MKLEYKKFSITLEKNISYETSKSAFDEELVNELTKFGSLGWEVVILNFIRVRFFGVENVCRCYYEGIFKRYIENEIKVIDSDTDRI